MAETAAPEGHPADPEADPAAGAPEDAPESRAFDPERMCGARTRHGPCRQWKMKGRTRCRRHGGKTPRGQRNNAHHGGYASVLTDLDRERFEGSAVGHLDDEIKLYRMRLTNVLEAEREEMEAIQDKLEDGFDYDDAVACVMEMVEHTEDVNGIKKVRKRTDYHKLVEILTARINQLEKTRAEMIAAAAGGIDAGDIAKKVRDAVREIDAMLGDVK